MLLATFPAPPKVSVSLFTSTTGTGASGEILETFHQINLSTIVSPTTNIDCFDNFGITDNKFINTSFINYN